MNTRIAKIENIDFYDHEKLKGLNEQRSRQWIKLFAKAKNGDAKAKKDLKKHEAEDQVLRARADETGFYWI